MSTSLRGRSTGRRPSPSRTRFPSRNRSCRCRRRRSLRRRRQPRAGRRAGRCISSASSGERALLSSSAARTGGRRLAPRGPALGRVDGGERASHDGPILDDPVARLRNHIPDAADIPQRLARDKPRLVAHPPEELVVGIQPAELCDRHRDDAEAVGFMLSGSRRVYFAGERDIFDGMDALARSLDVALLPISGWGPRAGRAPRPAAPPRRSGACALGSPCRSTGALTGVST